MKMVPYNLRMDTFIAESFVINPIIPSNLDTFLTYLAVAYHRLAYKLLLSLVVSSSFKKVMVV